MRLTRLLSVHLGLALCLTVASAPAQVTLDVPGTYTTIGDALKVAASGDTVLVQPGVYFELNLNFLGRDLVVKSVGGPDVTVIDAQQLGRLFVFENGETQAALIEGFTLQNGRAPSGVNGGLDIPGTDGQHGGAILIDQASPRILDCTFRWNEAGAGGRGGDGTNGDDGSAFGDLNGDNGLPGRPGGFGGSGGAIYVNQGVPTIDACRFLSNVAGRGGDGGEGGDGGDGGSSWPFTGDGGDGAPGGFGQRGGDGGALGTQSSTVLVRSCLFVDNHAGQNGSGGAGGFGGSGDLDGNDAPAGGHATPGWGGGVAFLDVSSEVNGCTLLDGTAFDGAGVYTSGSVVYNSILRGNLPDQLGGSPGVRHSNVEGGYTGVGNIDANPVFRDAPAGDYRLHAGSPCINTGDQLLGTLWTTDLEGIARVVALETDMGAHEYEVPYPGTLEDLVLLTQVAGVGDPLVWDKSALGGDTMTVTLDSPGLTFAWQKPMLALQGYTTGGVLPSSPFLASVHINGGLPGLTVIDLGGSPVGPVLLPPGGLTLGFVVPPGLVGTTVRLQGFVISPLAANGLYAATDAHEVTLL